MRIRVTKPADGAWYDNHIGEEFDVIRKQVNRRGETEYVVWEGRNGDYNWVDGDNCEIVEE